MLIRGKDLSANQRQLVLAAFVYRWTTENHQREASWRTVSGKPTIPLKTDAAWLAEHAFHFTKDGSRLMHNRPHAEPEYMAEINDNPAAGILGGRSNI